MTDSTLAMISTESLLLVASLVYGARTMEPVIRARRKQEIKTDVRAKMLFATTRPLLAAMDCPNKSGNDGLLTGSCDFAQDDELFWGNDGFLFSVCVCVCVCVCGY